MTKKTNISRKQSENNRENNKTESKKTEYNKNLGKEQSTQRVRKGRENACLHNWHENQKKVVDN